MTKAKVRPVIERLMDKVVIAPNGCWEWQGALDSDGYGSIRVGGKTPTASHAAYEVFKGTIPEGLEPDHTCRNRRCINPDHLELVTHRENVLRGDTANKEVRRSKMKTHCRKGHPYSYTNAKGHQICNICHAERERRRYHKQGGVK